jgi:hypothetical protein
MLSIQPHTPPRPFGTAYEESAYPREHAEREELWNETASAWCLSRPVVETPLHPEADKTRTIRITEQLACKDGRGVQVVRCVLDNDYSQDYVAKIYNPLYYSFVSRESGLPEDVTFRAHVSSASS